MKKHVIYCNPKDGRFNWEKEDIKTLPEKLKKYGRVKVTFEKYVPMKSLPQLGYYHGGILPFLEKSLYGDTGLSKSDWHSFLKDKFGIKKDDKTGLFTVIKSHAEYTEKEMAFYITQVITWVWEFFQIHIPGSNRIEEYL